MHNNKASYYYYVHICSIYAINIFLLNHIISTRKCLIQLLNLFTTVFLVSFSKCVIIFLHRYYFQGQPTERRAVLGIAMSIFYLALKPHHQIKKIINLGACIFLQLHCVVSQHVVSMCFCIVTSSSSSLLKGAQSLSLP